MLCNFKLRKYKWQSEMLIDEDFYLKELDEFEQEHQDLNEIIDDPDSHTKFSEFTLQKFKKRKLLVKDKIKLIKDLLTPDILA